MVAQKEKTMDFKGLSLDCADIIGRTRQWVVPIQGAKVGATSGWAVNAASNLAVATLPASQTNSTLVVPLTGFEIGDTLTAVSVMGQVESAGNAASLTLDVRKLTNVAADNTDASLGTDASGSITADAVLSSANLAVTGLSEVIAEGENVYALITATTAASTDIALTGLIVTVTRT